jgi:ADP-ribose pyrophosphatase
VISSDVVYRGRLFDVELDRLRFGNGIEANREILRHPGAVCMIPVAADGTIYFVTQYRHAAGRRLLELPAGTLEPGEDPADTAVRELQEEVGFRPGQVQPLGGFYVAPGYTSEYIHLFLCTELEASVLDGDDDEDIEIVALSAREAIEKIDNGEICDAKSIIGVLRWIHRDNG